MSVSCQVLDWDSNFFGHRIARLEGTRITPLQARSARDWCSSHNIDCLYFLADADDPSTVETAAMHGFQFVDIRLTLECSLSPTPVPAGFPGIRLAQPRDEDALCRLARESHYDSRFWADIRFRPRSGDFFETWMKNSCHGWAQQVFIAEHAEEPAGYCTCHVKDGCGSIGLVAVDQKARGFGLGTALVNSSLHWFASQGLSKVTVVTQGRNVAAQRLYQRSGFLTQSINLWFHLWLS